MTGKLPCFDCGEPSEHEHHVVPRLYGGSRTVPLCTKCHDRAHSKRSTAKALIVEGLARARARGAVVGRRPFGWRRLPNGSLEKDPVEQDLLARIFRLADERKTPRQIATQLLADTGRNVQHSSVYRILLRGVSYDPVLANQQRAEADGADDPEASPAPSAARLSRSNRTALGVLAEIELALQQVSNPKALVLYLASQHLGLSLDSVELRKHPHVWAQVRRNEFRCVRCGVRDVKVGGVIASTFLKACTVTDAAAEKLPEGLRPVREALRQRLRLGAVRSGEGDGSAA